MKKFLFRIIIFFAIIAVLDVCIGITFRYFRTTAKGGDTVRKDYIAYELDAPVLVFGSSRAIHHYDPQILKDSLKMDAYNCGLDGNGILYEYGLYQLLINRYKPKIIIIDIEPAFDIYQGLSNEKYLGALKWYSDEPGLASLYEDISRNERCKLISKMWRYNSVFIQIISDNVHPNRSNMSGYKPLSGVMNKEYKSQKKTYTNNIDSLKLKYWDKMLRQMHDDGVKVVLMVSPIYGGGDITEYECIRKLGDKYGFPFVSFLNDTKFTTKMHLFEDNRHMNHSGAESYTRDVIHVLDSIL